MDFEDRRNLSIASTPGGIERQEAEGQKAFIESATMPKDGDWEALSAWGVQRLEDADDLFCYCSLPEGWHKRPLDNPLWSELVNAEGCVRATIFYKAAFYDRRAFFDAVVREAG